MKSLKTKKKWKIKLEIVWASKRMRKRLRSRTFTRNMKLSKHTHQWTHTKCTVVTFKQQQQKETGEPAVNCVHLFEWNEKCLFQWMLNWHDVMMDVIRDAVELFSKSIYVFITYVQNSSRNRIKKCQHRCDECIAMSWSRSQFKKKKQKNKKNLKERNRKCILAMRQTHLISLFCILMSKMWKCPAASFNVFWGFRVLT